MSCSRLARDQLHDLRCENLVRNRGKARHGGSPAGTRISPQLAVTRAELSTKLGIVAGKQDQFAEALTQFTERVTADERVRAERERGTSKGSDFEETVASQLSGASRLMRTSWSRRAQRLEWTATSVAITW